MSAKVDTRELEAFAKKLDRAAGSGSGSINDFLSQCVKALAARVLVKTIKATPVDVGTLRRGWGAGKGAQAWAESANVVQGSGRTVIIITNPVAYAPYVEFGHRTRSGKGWVPGQYMLTIACQDIESMAPAILEKMLTQYLYDLFGDKR